MSFTKKSALGYDVSQKNKIHQDSNVDGFTPLMYAL